MGDVKWSSRRKGEGIYDAWSWVHVASGGALRVARVHWVHALAVLAAFELVEGGLRRIKSLDGGLFEYESWPNLVGDIAFGVAGYAGAAGLERAWKRLRKRSKAQHSAVLVAVSRARPSARVVPSA